MAIMDDFIRVLALVPELRIANVEFNVNEIVKQIRKINDDKKNVSVIVTPELSLTGYTCGDLFLQDTLLEEAKLGLEKLCQETSDISSMIVVGMPIYDDNQLYNCAVVVKEGKVLGVVPKSYIPNNSEFYEKRWFTSGRNVLKKIELCGEVVPLGTDIMFEMKEATTGMNVKMAIEICEDLWTINPPSSRHVANGADIIMNLSSSNEVIGKYEYRKSLVANQSAKGICGYVYVSSGVNESTQDLVFSGQALIYENGSLLKENERFDDKSNVTIADIDIKRLRNNRMRNGNFGCGLEKTAYEHVFGGLYHSVSYDMLDRNYDRYPFVPTTATTRDKRCEEIFNIQAWGLAKRLKHTGIKKTVIGISGGLDSTLAFLVIVRAYELLGIDTKNIMAVTMPGFGTTDRTYDNAVNLVKEYGATLQEVNIGKSCLQHFKDIGLLEGDYGVTYENAQARERTQILMDVANLENGLVIGTGDMSELALGWCTYNGDHMSMYAVNTSIPKTLVRYLVKWVGDNADEGKKRVINDIVETPISPELLPPKEDGTIAQVTEDKIGPYVLHDFFLYHMLRYGASVEKIYMLACKTFKDMYSAKEILKWLRVFVQRFFTQQFKRSCLPDGPKVGTISLSPRGDLRMPSDAECRGWLERITAMEKGEYKRCKKMI